VASWLDFCRKYVLQLNTAVHRRGPAADSQRWSGVEVLSRGVKPILGLIVLLAWPCLGWGGRAEASFALGRSALTPERAPGSPGFELRLVLNGDADESPVTHSSAGMAKETVPLAPGDSPRAPSPPRDLLPVPGGSPANGASTGTPSAGPGSGTGLSFIMPLACLVPGTGPSGFLFLGDDRLDPPPSASRLFRPPRAV